MSMHMSCTCHAHAMKMAVIMQEVVGEERDGHYYPTLAGK